MRRRRAFHSVLIAGVTAANPEAFGAIDQAELQRAFEPSSRLASAERVAEDRGHAIDLRTAEFVAAFNSSFDSAMAAFELLNRSSMGGAVYLLEARLQEYAAQKARWGSLDVHSVVPLSDILTVATARSQRTGEWLCIVLVFEPKAPYLLRWSRIDPMVVPV